jgi:5-methylcytosine-specific restriction protein A
MGSQNQDERMRREFSKQVRRDAFARASGRCEGKPNNGWRCPVKLTIGKYHYDHDIPDGLGGEPTLENCVVLCIACHNDKTAKRDVPMIAKAKRIADRHIGIKSSRHKIASRGFRKAPSQKTASRPIERRS